MIAEFVGDEAGVITTEFVAVVPAFIVFFTFFVDTCMLYFTYTDMYTVVRDVSRRMSTNQLLTMTDVRDYVAERLSLHGSAYTVSANPSRAECTVVITTSVLDAAIFGTFLQTFVGKTMSAHATTRREPLW